MYRYILSNTNGSSTKYGPCEVCGEHASEVWRQSEERELKIHGVVEGWTHYGCVSYFGHKECLESKQR